LNSRERDKRLFVARDKRAFERIAEPTLVPSSRQQNAESRLKGERKGALNEAFTLAR
jgi:hypothetical protein